MTELLTVSSSILNLDYELFYIINSRLSNIVFDAVLPFFRNKYFWLPVYVFILSFCIYNYGRRSYGLIIFLMVNVGVADFVSSEIIKKQIERKRPCQTDTSVAVRTLVRCGNGYSFTSSHAANHFALSFFLIGTLGICFKQIKGWLIAWASIVSFSQVYVGVHYPLDVLVGALLGITIAKLFVWLYSKSGMSIDFQNL